MPQRFSRSTTGKSDSWLRVAVVVVVLGMGLYSAWQRQPEQGQVAQPTTPRAEEGPRSPSPESNDRQQDHNDSTSANRALTARTNISRQTIRDQDGKVIFRGEVDVGPTLARIGRDERLEFAHDGTEFQNRERRLPRKPAGYYREYVHPTAGISGPGPQRIILGQEGETYYTPDHYRSFQRLDE